MSMKCPSCKGVAWCIDSRQGVRHVITKRRYQCADKCGKKPWSTVELMATPNSKGTALGMVPELERKALLRVLSTVQSKLISTIATMKTKRHI
jgi:hypothetical protein